MRTLAEIRAEIDALDAEIVPLLERRLQVADDVADAKRAEGRAIDDSSREQSILDAIAVRVAADCADPVKSVYRAVFAASKERQRRRRAGQTP